MGRREGGKGGGQNLQQHQGDVHVSEEDRVESLFGQVFRFGSDIVQHNLDLFAHQFVAKGLLGFPSPLNNRC